MNLKLLFIFVCVLISFVLFGCKQDGIKFYRESGVQKFMDDAKANLNIDTEAPTATRSKSGIVIYKDNSVKDTTGRGSSANFGPKDIDFDLPIK